MKRQRTLQKWVACACVCVFSLILASQHVAAARQSRVLSLVLFTSGIGMHLSGAILKGSAQNHYDTYLNTAVQAELQMHKDNYRSRKNTGTLMSRAGLGCVGLAVVFALYNQLHTPADVPSTDVSGGARLQNRFTGLHAARQRAAVNSGVLRSRTPFHLHPHYNLYTQQASLRLNYTF